MKRLISTILTMLLVLSSIQLYAQGWVRVYENYSNSSMEPELLPTPDGGFAMYTRQGLLKTDVAGNVLWVSPLDRILTYDNSFVPLQLPDGSYFVGAQALPGGGAGNDYIGMWYNMAGDTSSAKVIRWRNPQQLRDLIITQAGEYLWVGWSGSPSRLP